MAAPPPNITGFSIVNDQFVYSSTSPVRATYAQPWAGTDFPAMRSDIAALSAQVRQLATQMSQVLAAVQALTTAIDQNILETGGPIAGGTP